MKRHYLLAISIILSLFFLALHVRILEAATYYIDGSNGNDDNSGTINLPWKTIGEANSRLKAGDTVYIREGTYRKTIKPTNSGTSGNLITYQNYGTDTVTITGVTNGAHLDGKSYIKIAGIRIVNVTGSWVYAKNGADHCIFQNLYCSEAQKWAGIYLWDSDYNQILDCEFHGEYGPDDLVSIQSGSHHNLVRGCSFGKAPHQGLVFKGRYNVAINNTFDNPWHSCSEIGGMYEVFAHNTVKNAGRDHENIPDHPTGLWSREKDRNKPDFSHAGCQNKGDYSKIHNNIFINCGTAIMSYGYKVYQGEYNRYYNNTAYNCVYGYFVEAYSTYNYRGNVFKNNTSSTSDIYEMYYSLKTEGSTEGTSFVHNNFYGTSVYFNTREKSLGDIEANESNWSSNSEVCPGFTNALEEDFRLDGNSQLIDAAGWLATITSSTATRQTSFDVDDASYFFDGYGITSGDQIKTASGEVTRITNITSNTITVSPAIDIVKGKGVALTYEGRRPDIGAKEYIGSSDTNLTPPQCLRIDSLKES